MTPPPPPPWLLSAELIETLRHIVREEVRRALDERAAAQEAPPAKRQNPWTYRAFGVGPKEAR